MKLYDFINSNIGNKVYITPYGDLSINATFRGFIFNKTTFTLVRLTKGGMAILSDYKGREYSVPPRNVEILNQET